jgi:hypothetical protein
MYIYGGSASSGTQEYGTYTYTPATNTWAVITSAFYNLPECKSVNTGTDWLIYGAIYSPTLGSYYQIGLVHNFATNTWTEFATEAIIPNNDQRSNFVWAGTQMLMIRGYDAQKFTYTGTGYFISYPFIRTMYVMRKEVNI